MKALRIEPFSGIAGDMFVAAAAELADAGDEVRSLPAALRLEGVEVRLATVRRGGLEAQRLEVLQDGVRAEDAAPSHSHRALGEILAVVREADLEPAVRIAAETMLRRLGEVEAAVHGVSLEAVHLHEAGGVDSLVDIVASALLIERLAVDAVLSEPICVGYGSVSTAHGELPVPAPATASLLVGMPTEAGSIAGEMTTPTGAAILDHLAPRFEHSPFISRRTAYGAGSRELAGRPNVLRLSLGEVEVGTGDAVESLYLLETSVDDMAAELMAEHLVAGLLERGALDALLRPVIMKKGRPAIQVEVLCARHALQKLADYLLEHTTSLGVRWHEVQRRALPRERVEVETPFGRIAAKRAELPSGRVRVVPEFEDCRRAAERAGRPVLDVYRSALAAAEGDSWVAESEGAGS